MVTSNEIEDYLKNVPPLPKALKDSLKYLNEKELSLAAKAAASDPAIIYYLKKIVNSASYGFKQELKEPIQIFSALGIERAKQLLYAYMVESTAPNSWKYFKLKKDDFISFQISFIKKWESIVNKKRVDEKILSAASIMSAGLIVADAIFSKRASEVNLIKSNADLNLDTILKRVSGYSFDMLVFEIGKKWEVDEDILELIRLSFANEDCSKTLVCDMAKFLHLLLFYELSRPTMLNTGANSFISFNIEFVSEVLSEFESIVEIE